MRCARAVLVLDGERFRELARRIDRARGDVEHSVGARLTGKTGIDERVAVVRPIELDTASARQHDYHFRAGGAYRLIKLYLVGWDLDMFSVKPLRLADLVQTKEQQRDVRAFCKRDGFLDKPLFLLAVTVEALLEADKVERVLRHRVLDDRADDGDLHISRRAYTLTVFLVARRGLVHKLGYLVELGRIDYRRAGALIARVLGEAADYSDLRARSERKHAVVFKKDDAFFRALLRELVVRFLVEVVERRDRRGGFGKVEKPQDAFVDVLLVELARLHRFDYILDTVLASRHLEIAARVSRRNALVAARPV